MQDQPAPPTMAELTRRIHDLPFTLECFARVVLTAPGVTGAELLKEADTCAKVALACEDRDVSAIMEADARAWRDLAAILRDAAPRFPSPPRLPLTAEEADRAIRARSFAAGVVTASREPGR